MSDYLWEGKGRPDERVAELEALLSRYRRHSPPAPPKRTTATPRKPVSAFRAAEEIAWGWYAAAAAVLAIMAVSGILNFLDARRARQWTVTDARGSAKLARGGSVRTEAGKTARLESRAVGVVEVAENTVLRLLESSDGRAALELASGTIHARTISPPGVFMVETPRARAIDLGCEYTLRVEPSRRGRLHVDAGWVGLFRGGRESLVPAKASAVFDAEGRLTPPWFDDARAEFGEALRRFVFPAPAAAAVPDPAAAMRARALDRLLELARPRDGLTLINLFALPDVTREERMRIYDRLNALVPAPPRVTRERVADWTATAADEWWPAVRAAAGVAAIPKKPRPPVPLPAP